MSKDKFVWQPGDLKRVKRDKQETATTTTKGPPNIRRRTFGNVGMNRRKNE